MGEKVVGRGTSDFGPALELRFWPRPAAEISQVSQISHQVLNHAPCLVLEYAMPTSRSYSRPKSLRAFRTTDKRNPVFLPAFAARTSSFWPNSQFLSQAIPGVCVLSPRPPSLYPSSISPPK